MIAASRWRLDVFVGIDVGPLKTFLSVDKYTVRLIKYSLPYLLE